MPTIFCYTDLVTRYDDSLDYTGESINAHLLYQKDYGKRDQFSGEYTVAKLGAMGRSLLAWLRPGQRYRVVCSHARLVFRNADLASLRDVGALVHRRIEGEYVSLATGHMLAASSVLHALERYPTIVSLTEKATGSEVCLIDLANYGLGWDDHFQLVHQSASAPYDMPVYECDLMPGEVKEGLQWLADLYGELGKFCRQNKVGRPSLTYAAQGSAAYYMRGDAHPIRQTTNSVALALENNGYFGGRHEPFGYGHYEGECSLFDVSAFYPFLASRQPVPFEYVGYVHKPTLEEALETARRYYTLADVTLVDGQGRFPIKCGFLTKWPEGRLRTTLHHAEFSQALGLGLCAEIHTLIRYRADLILADVMKHYLSVRASAEHVGNKLWAHFAKTQSVGLIGKLGSRMAVWEDDNDVIPPEPDSHWCQSTLGSGKLTYYRSVGWQAQRKRDDLIPYHGSLAMAGAINSYGREFLGGLIDYAGRQNVLYVATDSLLVTAAGARKLRLICGRNGWSGGSVREVENAAECTVAGHGVYEIGARAGMQGFARQHIQIAESAIRKRRYGPVNRTADSARCLPALSEIVRRTYVDTMAKARATPWQWHRPVNELGR